MNIARLGLLSVLVLALLLGGCAATVHTTSDPQANLAAVKTYSWLPSSSLQGDLVLKNIVFEADQVLARKGLQKAAEAPDLLMAAAYDNEIGINQYGYELRMLTISMYTAANRQLVWRGTATGSIDASTSSKDLKSAVEKILAAFPPK